MWPLLAHPLRKCRGLRSLRGATTRAPNSEIASMDASPCAQATRSFWKAREQQGCSNCAMALREESLATRSSKDWDCKGLAPGRCDIIICCQPGQHSSCSGRAASFSFESGHGQTSSSKERTLTFLSMRVLMSLGCGPFHGIWSS